MSFPLSQGSTPFSGTIPADTWTLICDSVSLAKITNLYVSTQNVWLTYTPLNDPAPIDFDDPEMMWRMKSDTAQFKNSIYQSKIYAYPKDKEAEIGVQT